MDFVKKNAVILGFLLTGLFLSLGFYYNRLDLTADKRYTLTKVSKDILKSIDDSVVINVYLEGDFPANFKQLQSETLSLLDEMKRVNPYVIFQLVNPQTESKEAIQAMGMQKSVLNVKKDGISTQIDIYPYATVRYKQAGRTVSLIVDQSGISGEEQVARSVENLEYNFMDAINMVEKLSKKKLKSVGLLYTQKELNKLEMYSFASRIVQSYNFGPVIPKDSMALSMEDLPNMKRFDALVIAKPRKAFTEEEKMVVDQYIMNGGKTLWALDVVNAEMDTLLRSSKILAYPYDLNLTDLLFSYGVRINPGVVKDIQNSAYINLQVGEVQGNAQNAKVPWVYFPLGMSLNNHPITKNINPVRFEFPSPIDTLETKGLKKTILYQSSSYTSVQSIPSYISLEEARVSDKNDENLAIYNKGPKVMAVLLEGKFTSAYAEKIESSKIKDFKKESKPNKMIVISDGDVARNQVVKGQPLPLGFDYNMGVTYGNEEFLINALDYLLDDNGLMALRNRTVDLRLLNKQSIVMDKSYWQWLNMIVPLLFIGALASIFIFIRRRIFIK